MIVPIARSARFKVSAIGLNVHVEKKSEHHAMRSEGID